MPYYNHQCWDLVHSGTKGMRVHSGSEGFMRIHSDSEGAGVCILAQVQKIIRLGQ